MSVELRVRNFQSIRDASITIDRFTVVTGQNNGGKSALVRAFKALGTNARGSDFVRHGESSCLVDVQFSDGRTISWEKGEKVKPRYVVQGREFHPGREVPQEIADAGLAPVTVGDRDLWPQIASQFTGQVFLLDQPGSVLAELVSDVDRVGHLNRAMRAADSDRRSAIAEQAVRQSDLESIQGELKSLDGLDDALAKVSQAETTRAQGIRLEQKRIFLDRLRQRLISARHGVSELVGLLEVPVPKSTFADDFLGLVQTQKQVLRLKTTYQACQEQLANLAGVSAVQVPHSDRAHQVRILEKNRSSLAQVFVRLQTARQDQEHLSPVLALSAVPDFAPCTRMIGQRARLVPIQERLSGSRVELSRLESSKVQSEQNLSDSSQAVRDLLGSMVVCPVCETGIHDEVKHRMTSPDLNASARHAIQSVRNLAVPPNGLAVINVSNQLPDSEAETLARLIQQGLEDAGNDSVTVLVTTTDFDVRMLNEKQMAEMGWHRIPEGWGRSSGDDN